MTEAATVDKLIALIRDVLDDYDTPITSDTAAEDVPAWDSVNHINIVVGTEQAFRIKFRAAELEKLTNVGEYAALIEEKVAHK
jgi:acyl carrier protein